MRLRFWLAHVFLLSSLVLWTGCVTRWFESSMERCNRYDASLVAACQKSVRDTGSHRCFHKYRAKTVDDVGYAKCAGRPLYTEQETFCLAQLERGTIRGQEECDAHWQCRNAQDKGKCVWSAEHPIEADCEKQAEKHGGYWECVKIGHENQNRARDRQTQQRALEIQREALQQKLDADAAYQERQLELQEEQIELQERQQRREAIRAVGDSFKPKPAVNCISTPNYAGQMVTQCQ